MKNSAWYHKFWRDKLGEVPLKKNDAAAWADMRNLLDEQLPATIGKRAYKLNNITKTILLLITVSIIIIPAVLHINKRYAASFKNSKHLNEHKVTHNASITLTGKPSGQNSNNLTLGDSNHYHSDSSAVSISPNRIGDSSLNVSKNPVTVNYNLQPQNTAYLSNNAKQHQTDNKFKNGDLLNILSATRQSNISKQNHLKVGNGNKNVLTTGNKQTHNHLSISGQNSFANYTSTKANHSKATKNGSKIKTDEASVTRENNINGKAIAYNTIAKPTKASKLNNDKEEANTKIDPVKSPINNSDIKEAQNSGSKRRTFNTAQKTVKTKENKTKSNTKKPKANDAQPKYNYGLELGYNAGRSHSLYGGILGSYQIKSRWTINIGLRLNTYTTISGEYSHQSYYNPDSIPPFKIKDSRKVMALTIPLTLEYKLNGSISLKGGPIISMPIKQSGISSSLGIVADIRDTVYKTQTIDSTLKKTTINKLNIGFTGGVSIQIKHFSIEAMYQVLTPYKISSGLGSYQKSNQNFQIGIGYRFK